MAAFPERKWLFGAEGLQRADRGTLVATSGQVDPTGQLEPRDDGARAKAEVTKDKKRQFLEAKAWELAISPGKQFMMTGTFQPRAEEFMCQCSVVSAAASKNHDGKRLARWLRGNDVQMCSIHALDDGVRCSYHEHHLHILPVDHSDQRRHVHRARSLFCLTIPAGVGAAACAGAADGATAAADPAMYRIVRLDHFSTTFLCSMHALLFSMRGSLVRWFLLPDHYSELLAESVEPVCSFQEP